MKRILVFRDTLLPLSETFVANQSLRLKCHEAYFLGSRRASSSISLPEERLFLLNAEGGRSLTSPGFLNELRFKLFGFLPKEGWAWISRVRPLLLHAHFAPDGALALPIAKALNLSLVVSLHGTDITLNEWAGFWRIRSWHSYKIYLLRKAQLQKAARAFLVPSRFLLRKALERGYPEEKLHLVPHGVDTDRFHPDPEKVVPGRILYVGRLIELKGLPFLLQALAPLAGEFPHLRLVVVGDGPKREEYQGLAERLLPGRVEFLGAQPGERVREEMQRAYLFSMPSVSLPSGETETFGLVYLEAQASGAPVVAFATGGVPEVVADRETGFLAPERDVEGLRRRIRDLLEWEDLRNKMGLAARAWVRERFELRKTNALLEDTYDAVLRGGL